MLLKEKDLAFTVVLQFVWRAQCFWMNNTLSSVIILVRLVLPLSGLVDWYFEHLNLLDVYDNLFWMINLIKMSVTNNSPFLYYTQPDDEKILWQMPLWYVVLIYQLVMHTKPVILEDTTCRLPVISSLEYFTEPAMIRLIQETVSFINH